MTDATSLVVDENKPELALTDLGVRPELLTAAERRSLDIDGVVVLEDVITPDQLSDIQERLDTFLAAQEPGGGTDDQVRRRAKRRVEVSDLVLESLESYKESLDDDTGRDFSEERVAEFRQARELLSDALASDDLPAMRTYLNEHSFEEFVDDDLFESDPAFDLVLQSPRVLSAVAHVLGPMFHILNQVARCPRPGQGQQELHRTEYGPRRIATTIWLIDEMTLANGPTRMVLGSHHRSDGLPEEMEGDSTRPHPEETKLTAPAGAVVVFDDRNWHGGSLHNGGGPRRVVISSFTQRSLSQPMAVKYPEETLNRLSLGQRWLLHVEPEVQPAAV